MSNRNFLPSDFKIEEWDHIEGWLKNLRERELKSLTDLEKWMLDNSEFESVVSEDMAWRYIKMTIDTRDSEKQKAYQFFVTEIAPKMAPYSDELNKKLVDCQYSTELQGKEYDIYLRKIRKEIEMFREENIPLQSEIATLAQKFGEISGGLQVELNGVKMTLQQASKELLKPDRNDRKKAWNEMSKVRLEVKDELNELFSQLIELRTKIALNAGYSNFRDYMFDALGRFDYTKEDCFDFHQSIAEEIIPLAGKIAEKRKLQLGVENLKPYDMRVDPKGLDALKPFDNVDNLLSGSIEIFEKIDPFFGHCLRAMKEGGYLDLGSKEGKAPGGYNYPLYESGIPFIFMNAVGTPRDLVTMMHEGGHAVHSFLTQNLKLTSFKSCPSEVAELASMTMELLSMDHWGVFYKNEEDLKRAKREHLEDIIATLPWIAIIDKFQHWIYENPEHTLEERKKEWLSIEEELSHNVTGLDRLRGQSGFFMAKTVAFI